MISAPLFSREGRGALNAKIKQGDDVNDYAEYLKGKAVRIPSAGIDIADADINPNLFPFQKAAVKWAAKRGRAALWFDTGLGKTRMQLAWADLLTRDGGRALILAPLAVAHQTVAEAAKIGVPCKYAKTESEATGRITITNYERLDAFTGEYRAVVLDESSILKSFDGSTRSALIERFADTPYRLACTATPAPNDHLELGNHAQFLGIMTRQEMAAEFFVHDQQAGDGNRGHKSGAWRLKGHAEDAFWKWLVSWGVFVKRPSDIGFDDDGYNLPPLEILADTVDVDKPSPGHLFAAPLHGIGDRLAARRDTITERVQKAAELIIAEPHEQWLAWCGLNDEADELVAAVPGAVQVAGNDEPEVKAERLLAFARGEIRVLVSKVKIAGFGMNFQKCARQVFVGVNDSYESYYQAIRRSWRFGQTRPVRVHVVVSSLETEIVSNIKRKELEADKMSEEMVKRMADLETAALHGAYKDENPYKRNKSEGKSWTMYLGDCVDVMREMPEASIDLSVYSPPFSSLYTYSASVRDMGNCHGEDEFFKGFSFCVAELLRITKPGRLTACHVAQLAAMASRDGFIGLKDFRGRVIDAFVAAGWIHHGEAAIDKNPQAQAIRTKTKGLLFVQLRKDSSWMRPALADFLLIFRKPGDNAVPVHPDDVSNEDWISWAHPCWTGINETDTLSAREAREEKDEKHICPLQLGVIDRAVRLWSNRGETVFSPFGGIGSEGYQSILRGRKFIGAELKESYWRAACRNLAAAEAKSAEGSLFAEPARAE